MLLEGGVNGTGLVRKKEDGIAVELTMDAGPKVQQNNKTIAKATAVVVLRFQNCRMADEEGDLPAMPLAVCACGVETIFMKESTTEPF